MPFTRAGSPYSLSRPHQEADPQHGMLPGPMPLPQQSHQATWFPVPLNGVSAVGLLRPLPGTESRRVPCKDSHGIGWAAEPLPFRVCGCSFGVKVLLGFEIVERIAEGWPLA